MVSSSIERISKKDEFDSDSTTPIYLARKLNRTRGKVSELMNGLIQKGLLIVAETRTNTKDGRIGITHTWLVNPNIICCSPEEQVSRYSNSRNL